MPRGRNKTPAERALEVICSMSGMTFQEFQELLDKSQGDKASQRVFPETSYDMIKNRYFKNSSVNLAQWKELASHVKSPRDNFGDS